MQSTYLHSVLFLSFLNHIAAIPPPPSPPTNSNPAISQIPIPVAFPLTFADNVAIGVHLAQVAYPGCALYSVSATTHSTNPSGHISPLVASIALRLYLPATPWISVLITSDSRYWSHWNSPQAHKDALRRPVLLRAFDWDVVRGRMDFPVAWGIVWDYWRPWEYVFSVEYDDRARGPCYRFRAAGRRRIFVDVWTGRVSVA